MNLPKKWDWVQAAMDPAAGPAAVNPIVESTAVMAEVMPAMIRGKTMMNVQILRAMCDGEKERKTERQGRGVLKAPEQRPSFLHKVSIHFNRHG